MARKRKKIKGLDYQSQEYWNRLLASQKLSMSQGEHPKLVTMSTHTLSIIENYAALGGRKLKKKTMGQQEQNSSEME